MHASKLLRTSLPSASSAALAQACIGCQGLWRSTVPSPPWHRRACAAAGRAQEQPGSAMILDDADWQSIQDSAAEYDANRELVIKRTRDAQKAAKQAIYSLHRADFSKAGQQLQTVEHVARELLPIVQAEPTLRQGSYAAAMEEYAEAMVFRAYLQEGRVLRSSEVAGLVQRDEFLSGVLDFCGELNRWAVARATVRDAAAVSRARDVVDELQGRFLEMDLRNGALRKKFDSLKYTLRKLEAMLYELSLAESAVGPGITRSVAEGGARDEEQQQAAAGDGSDTEPS